MTNDSTFWIANAFETLGGKCGDCLHHDVALRRVRPVPGKAGAEISDGQVIVSKHRALNDARLNR
jgi:hypothetical protein